MSLQHENSRRLFIKQLLSITAIGALAPSALAQSLSRQKIKALAFDAFPIFDPRPVFAMAEKIFPGKGQELSNLWRTRQFEYQWLRALSGEYKDFKTVTQDALVFAANTMQLDLSDENRAALMDTYFNLKIWPDVLPALKALHNAGIKLVFLSNMTEDMLRRNMEANGISSLMYAVYSTDSNHSYKPSTKAYQIAVDKLKLRKTDIGFVAFAGWDASGAKLFGYPTYWVNRQNQKKEELGATADWTGNNLTELVKHLGV